ncbi:MAG: molybdate transport system ATP-binding protein [Thermoleophilaceae bacterium]|nr:molybdate transport system ATP-binding protein [Thermoleophilaceae bacterium]
MLELEARTRVGDLDLDVSLDVSAGMPVALAGPSGAGKTTLLRIVAGLAAPRSGRVSCDGDIWLDTERGVDVPPEQRRCGLVFQDHALFPHLSAWRNVAYGAPGGRAARRAHALELLDRLGVAHRSGARPRELSGGERQRVAVARALAARPRALLLDEPLASLDPRTRARAARELAALLPGLGVPVVAVTHDFGEAATLAGEVAVLDAGRIVQRATPGRLAAAPASGFVADFTGAVVLSGTASAGEGELTAVQLDGGGAVTSVDEARGPVAVSVHPWDVAIEPVGATAQSRGSARNRVDAEVVAVTAIGNRTRVGLAAPQPLAAEITTASAGRLRLAAGDRVTAVWKAASTRLSQI